MIPDLAALFDELDELARMRAERRTCTAMDGGRIHVPVETVE